MLLCLEAAAAESSGIKGMVSSGLAGMVGLHKRFAVLNQSKYRCCSPTYCAHLNERIKFAGILDENKDSVGVGEERQRTKKYSL